MKSTYTKKELQKEAKKYALYYGREELMTEAVKKQYDEFLRKVEIYEKEKRAKM